MSAKRRPTLSVVLAPPARRDLDEIWIWNRKTFGAEHAERYIELLQRQLDALGDSYDRGIPVEGHAHLRYLRLGRRRSGPGHIALYRVVRDEVHVARVVHTAQNWQSSVSETLPEGP